MGRDPGASRGAVPPAAQCLQPACLLGLPGGFWRGQRAIDAGVGPRLDAGANGGGAGLVPSATFETRDAGRAFGHAVLRSEDGEPGSGTAGRRQEAAQLLDRESSHRSVDRSRPGGSLAGISGSSEEGTSPTAPKARAPGPPCGSGRASAKTVTRSRYPLPTPPRGVSRAEIANSSVGSESSRPRWRDTCGASQRRSSRACRDRRTGLSEECWKRAAGEAVGSGIPGQVHDEGRERYGPPRGRPVGGAATAPVVVHVPALAGLGHAARVPACVSIPPLGPPPPGPAAGVGAASGPDP